MIAGSPVGGPTEPGIMVVYTVERNINRRLARVKIVHRDIIDVDGGITSAWRKKRDIAIRDAVEGELM